MRIRRLRLENYRGVVDRTLTFPTTGVTIVEGPNEIGKSSIAEALEIVFNYRDSTKSRNVLSVQPVDQDVPTTIEVEVETGPYRFTYSKRFFRKPQTILKITDPRAETLKGRTAHERALAILEETIDLALWRAMQVRQDEPIGQADLKPANSLSRALDKVAGQETAGDRETSLFDRVRAEYLVFFTETGLPRKPLKEAAEAESKAALRKEEIERDLKAMERDVERAAELQREIGGLTQETAERAREVERRDKERAELKKREDEVNRLELTAKSAKMSETMARKAAAARRGLLDRAKKARTHREELEAEAADRAPALKAAEESLRTARELLAASEAADRDAQAIAELRERDFEYERAKLNLEQLQERQRRIRDAREQAATAREALERIRVDEGLLTDIERLHLALVESEARLDAASPRLTIRALTDVVVQVDDETVSLSEGETNERAVAERARLRLAGAEIVVDAGTSVDELSAKRDEARRELLALLTLGGIETVAAARAAVASRNEARRVVEAAEKLVEDHLRDLTPDDMEKRIARLQAWVDSYPTERPAAPAPEQGHDDAYRARKAAKTALGLAAAASAKARRDEVTAREKLEHLRKQAQEVNIKLRLGAEAEKAVIAELDQARTEAPDLELDRAMRDTAERGRAAETEHTDALNALQAAQPERVRQLAFDTRRQAESAASQLRRAQDEVHEVSARLELLGERGLFEELQKATTEHERLRRENGAVVRRAGAARVLYETMSAAREAARRAYAAPLREEIVRLGAYVFDEKLSVDLDNDLRITSRTLNGQTLGFGDLSVGAREQLSLISRLACALLVDKTEGVPIIFDDTLGHSDPTRLEGMGAMLSRAGESCQIIVLTCTPGRFRHVADANVIRL